MVRGVISNLKFLFVVFVIVGIIVDFIYLIIWKVIFILEVIFKLKVFFVYVMEYYLIKDFLNFML